MTFCESGQNALVGKYCATDCAMKFCTLCRVEILVNLTAAHPFFLASNLQRNSCEFACVCKLLKAKREGFWGGQADIKSRRLSARAVLQKAMQRLRGRSFLG